MAETKAPTHCAYAVKREGQHTRWLEIGTAIMHTDGKGFDVHLDRLPVGGFNGRILVCQTGRNPEEAGLLVAED
jgi:hypothetical protein